MNNLSSVGGSAVPLPPQPAVRPVSSDVSVTEDRARLPQSGEQTSVAPVLKVAPPPADLEKLVVEMQNKVSGYSPELQFSVDEDSGKTIVRMTDKTTKDVVWQFPSEDALQMAKELDRYQQGLVLHSKV
ncbi:MAG: flagellar protein FlaG [Rhodoferax sp.]